MNKKSSILTAMIGNSIEFMNYSLYGLLAVFLAPQFFGTSDRQLALTLSFLAFAASFVTRPLGGFILGILSDKYGRKKILSLSLLLMSIPSLIIGLLPAYSTIGVSSPIVLLVCRLIQGFSIGGQYMGATVFIHEHSRSERKGFAYSCLAASSLLGIVVGGMFGALCINDNIYGLTWRFPFILSGLLGLILFKLSLSLQESPEFLKDNETHLSPNTNQYNYSRPTSIKFFSTLGIAATALGPFYVVTIYLIPYVVASKFHFSHFQSLTINSGVLAFCMCSLPLAGILSDKIGKIRLMKLSSILLTLVAMPMTILVYDSVDFSKTIALILGYSFLAMCFVAPSGALLAELFHARVRNRSLGFGYELGGAILGGSAPLILDLLGKSISPIKGQGFYLLGIGLLGWVAVRIVSGAPQQSTENRDLAVS